MAEKPAYLLRDLPHNYGDLEAINVTYDGQHYEAYLFNGLEVPWYRSIDHVGLALMGRVDLAREYWNGAGTQHEDVVLKIFEQRCLGRPGETHYCYNEHRQFQVANEDPWTEMKILNHLGGQHNIVELKRAMKKAEEPCDTYLAFPFYGGGDLWKYLHEHRNDPFSENQIRDIFVKILVGVGYFHSHGIFHGDLSPENVLITRDASQVAITDFGMAGEAPLHPDSGLNEGVRGKPLFVAPEVLTRPRYDGILADMFSLGRVLYVMLGYRLLTRATIVDVFNPAKTVDHLGRLKSLNPRIELSENARDCVCKLLGADGNTPLNRWVVVKRTNAEVSILDHPWLQEHTGENAFPRAHFDQLMRTHQARQARYLQAQGHW